MFQNQGPIAKEFMMDDCCADTDTPPEGAYKRVLWIVLGLNAGMFVVEILYGLQAGSVSLLADASDFFADSANYGIALLVLGRSMMWRSSAALLKSGIMAGMGIWILTLAVSRTLSGGQLPVAEIMGVIGVLALVANVISALLLYAWRQGDANMRSVWLCSRNDAIANLAVIGAAFLVYRYQAMWPDLIVGLGIMALCMHSAWSIMRQSVRELRQGGDEAPQTHLSAAE